MNLLIAGGTGTIGTALVNSLLGEHEITILGRDSAKIKALFSNQVATLSWDELEQTDPAPYQIVVNLAGYNIADARWTPAVKKEIIDSRVNTTHTLINWLKTHQCKPRFFSANAVGIYGLQANGDKHALDEDTPIDLNHSHDFLSEVGRRWQQALQPAIDYGMPVTILRFGVALKRDAGLLKKLLPTFEFGLGSIVGDGKQVISWIGIGDLVQAFHFLLAHPELTGPINLTAPHPVSQGEFAKTMADVLKKPCFLTTPAFVTRMLFGDMGECLINRGARVVPKRLLDAGFKFDTPTLKPALTKILKKI